MSKSDYKVTVSERFSRGAQYNLYFEREADAKAAKATIITAKTAYDEKRPNDPASKWLTIAHDLGDLTIPFDEIGTVAMFNTAEAADADKDRLDDAANRQAKLIAAAIREALRDQARETSND